MPASSELTDAISVLKTDVGAFVEAGKTLPEKAPEMPTVVKGIEKLEAGKLKQFQNFWKENLNSKKNQRNRRKVLYMLAGPVPALIGAAIVAGGPITLPAAGIALGGFAIAFCVRKGFSNLQAAFQKKAAAEFKVNKTTEAIVTVEKWIQKRILSKVADAAEECAEAWRDYDQLSKKPIASCADAVRIFEAAVRARKRIGDIAEDAQTIIDFSDFVVETYNDINTKEAGKRTVEQQVKTVSDHVKGMNHNLCTTLGMGTCYEKTDKGKPKSPRYQTPKAFAGAMLKFRDPVTRIWNDAAIRVLRQGKKEAFLKPGIVMTYPDLEEEWKRLLAGLAVEKAAAPEKNKDDDPKSEDGCVELVAKVGKDVGAQQVAGAALKTAQVIASDQFATPLIAGSAINFSTMAGALANDANLLVAPMGLVVGVGKVIGDGIYVKKELEALRKELEKKEISERDESNILKALRAVLKDGKYFNLLAEELEKMHKIAIDEIPSAVATTKDLICSAHFDLAVNILRLAKHRERVLAKIPFFMMFAQIIKNLLDRSSGEGWDKEMAELDKKLEAFFPKHKNGPCGGWCYNGSTVKVMDGFISVVSSKGGVEDEEELAEHEWEEEAV